jgi:hypothetical protein
VIDLTVDDSANDSEENRDMDVEIIRNFNITYHNNPNLPLYLSRNNVKQRTSSLHYVQAIMNCPPELVCTSHPTNINKNCTFVVDTSKLRSPDDIKCDDCGAWRQTKTATQYLEVNFDEDGSVVSVTTALYDPNFLNQYYTLLCRHYVCISAPDLTRHLASLSYPDGSIHHLKYIQYKFSGVEHKVEVKPHGNAKKSIRPYKRTCPSTISDLKEELKEFPPKRAAYRVETKRGGILNATCEGDLPHNTMQFSSLKSNTSISSKVSDPLQALVIKLIRYECYWYSK